MTEYSVFSSQLVRREIERMQEPHRTGYLNLVKPFDQLAITDETAILAEEYIHRGIFHRKFLADALHYALASFHKVDYLVTWNFGYMANVQKQARLRLFNQATGFFAPQVVTPEFLVHAV
jgi:hypothetical protein